MDDLDALLLALMEKKPFSSKTSMARALKVSEGTVRNRLKRLLDSGKIIFRVDYSTGQEFRAIVLVKCETKKPTSQLSQQISKLAEVSVVYEVSGNHDLVVRCNCFNALEYNKVIDKIRAMDGIVSTETLIILKAN